MINLKRLALTYFKPKPIEYYREATIYDLVGIRIYKKYLPSTGVLVRRWRRIKQINFERASRTDELYKYERKTRNYEWRHLIGIIILIVLTLLIDRRFSVFDWVFISLLNLFVNIYPIFLQRYNRIRIINALKNNGHNSPYEF
jgi:glycosyl-4,4'-diaponeurosporenoate acyltransferase